MRLSKKGNVAKLYLHKKRRSPPPAPVWNYALNGTWKLGELPFFGNGGTAIEDTKI